MKLFADDVFESEDPSPTRRAADKIMRPLCLAWLSANDGENLIEAFNHLRQAHEYMYDHLGTPPAKRPEQTSISRESLKAEIFDAVSTVRKAMLQYDTLADANEGLEPTKEMKEAEAYLEKTLKFARLYLDGWTASRTAAQCRRYDRLLHPERYLGQN